MIVNLTKEIHFNELINDVYDMDIKDIVLERIIEGFRIVYLFLYIQGFYL